MRTLTEKAVIEGLKKYLKRERIKQTELARRLGWSPQDVNDILKGRKPIGKQRQLYIGRSLEINFEREMIELLEETASVKAEELRIKETDGYIVKLVDGYIEAGTGSIPLDEIKEEIWIPKKYLRSAAGHEDRYVAIEVRGNSMEPILQNGEIVIVDRADCDITKIGKRSVYAVRTDGKNIIKHLHYIPKDNMLELISANSQWIREYGFEYVKLDEIEENPIVGKVVFSFRGWK